MSSSLVVRLITPDERERFDGTLVRSHWLGAGVVGEVLRYVALEDSEWCALLGFGSAALCVASREELLGWSDEQRYRRLRYLTNNQRFCVLDEHRRAKSASQVLSMTLRRLSADFEARWGHPVVMVETFTDPARHLGTCYQASNFTRLATTSGYGRRSGRFVHHGTPKAYWTRLLRRDALRLLSSDFDHSLLARRPTLSAVDLNRLDLDGSDGLLARLAGVREPRKARGVRHRLAPILAIATVATLRGATSLRSIGETAAEPPQEALARLGARVSPRTRAFVAPEESTIRRSLRAIDADAFDAVVNAWVADQVAAGRLDARQAPTVQLAAVLDCEPAAAGPGGDLVGDPHEEALLPAIAVDAKSLRGACLDDGRRVHLLSAMTHLEGVSVAQREVDTKTNEITGFAPLLQGLDLHRVVVTADPMHAQRDHMRLRVEEKGAHFVFGLKANQPKLRAAAQALLAHSTVVHEEHDRGHGRTEHRYLRVAAVPLAGVSGLAE